MKKIAFTYLSFLLLLFNLQIFSQNHVITLTPQTEKSIRQLITLVTPNPTWYTHYAKSYPIDYEYDNWQNNSGETFWSTVRTGYKFNLPNIPSYASNITAKIEAYRSNGSGNSKIVLMSDDTDFSKLEGESNGVYKEVGSGTVLFITPTSQGVLNNVTSQVVSRISQGYINIGVTPDGSSMGEIIIKLHIDYEVPITVQNNFSGGSIKVGVNSNAVSRTSPYPLSVPVGGTVNLKAVEQYKHDYNWIWNDTEAPLNKSDWKRIKSGQSIYKSSNILYSFNLEDDDHNAIYEAGLRKKCDYTFKNKHSGGETGGSIKVNGSTVSSPSSNYNVVELNAITGEAINHTINGVYFSFSKWTPGNSTSRTKTFNPSAHTNYEAVFTGRPTNPYRNQSFNTKVVGQPIKVYWDQHPNTNVTKYGVYRKTKFGSEQLVKTVNRTGSSSHSYTYTDPSYVHTSNTSTTNLLSYDVRAYYSPDAAYSDYDWRTLYAEVDLLPKETEELVDEEIIIEKYEYGISNYPNPYNPSTTINYQIKEMGNVSITVYDALGREVKVLINDTKQPGSYNVMFDGSDLTSGIYFYSMRVNDFMETKKMLLTK